MGGREGKGNFYYLDNLLKKNNLFLAMLGLAVCGVSLAAASRGQSLVVVHRLLTGVASLVTEHRL